MLLQPSLILVDLISVHNKLEIKNKCNLAGYIGFFSTNEKYFLPSVRLSSNPINLLLLQLSEFFSKQLQTLSGYIPRFKSPTKMNGLSQSTSFCLKLIKKSGLLLFGQYKDTSKNTPLASYIGIVFTYNVRVGYSIQKFSENTTLNKIYCQFVPCFILFLLSEPKDVTGSRNCASLCANENKKQN